MSCLTTGPKAKRWMDNGLKPQNLWPKINLFFFYVDHLGYFVTVTESRLTYCVTSSNQWNGSRSFKSQDAVNLVPMPLLQGLGETIFGWSLTLSGSLSYLDEQRPPWTCVEQVMWTRNKSSLWKSLRFDNCSLLQQNLNLSWLSWVPQNKLVCSRPATISHLLSSLS
jgi:hypothetical protein